MKRLIIIILFGFSFSGLRAQGETALSMAAEQVSTPMLAAGITGTANLNPDVLNFAYNPAQLGYSSRLYNFGFSIMPQKTVIPAFVEFTAESYGFQAGYDFETLNKSLPLSVGIGLIHSKWTYGRWAVTGENSPEPIGYFTPAESYTMLSIGASYKYYAYFNFGLSVKFFDSFIAQRQTANGWEDVTAEGSAWDLGFLFILPVSELWLNKPLYSSTAIELYPAANFSTAYSVNNIGDEIYYIDPAQSDPLTRIGRLGYNLNLGLEGQFKEQRIKMIDYNFTAEADDILVNRSMSGISYDNIPGKFSPVKNLLMLEGNNQIYVHKGHSINFFDTFTYLTGSTAGRSFGIKTEGAVVSTKGVFNWISTISDNDVLRFITRNIELSYSRASVRLPSNSLVPDNVRKYESIAVYLKKII